MAEWPRYWAKWLHDPCRLGGPQRPARGQKSEMATWPTFEQIGYITHAVLEIPNAQRGEKNQKWLCSHIGAKGLHHPCRLGGPQRPVRGHELAMATWPTCGKNGYITPAVLGVPNARHVDKNHKWLRGPHVGKVATSNLPYWGSPTLSTRTKIKEWLRGPHVSKVFTSPVPS